MTILQTAGYCSQIRRRAICQSDPAHGVLLTGKFDSREPRTWQLRWTAAPNAVVRELLRDVREGAFVPMPFTPPGGSEVNVIYWPPVVEVQPISSVAADCAVTVEELLNTEDN